MTSKFKRFLSILLSLALIISMIPAIPAAAEEVASAQNIAIDASTLIKNTNEDRYTLTVDNGVMNIKAQCRTMGDTPRNGYRTYVALPFVALSSGDFNIYFKTDDPTAKSADTAIFVIENTGSSACTMIGCKTQSAITNNKVMPCYFLDDDYELAKPKMVGRFNFSKAEKSEYEPVLKGDSAASISLAKDKSYYLVIYCDSESLKNQPIALSTHSDQTKYPDGTDVYAKYIEAGANAPSAFSQAISLSDIKLVPNGQNPDGEESKPTGDFAFPNKILHVGETLKLPGVPNGATLISSDTSVLTVTNDGEITGKKIGKATVTIEGTDLSVEIPVVGENLIEKAKSGDSYFANGIYHKTEGVGTTTDSSATKWTVSKFGELQKLDNILLPGFTSPVSGIKATYVAGGANRLNPQGSTSSEANLKKYYTASGAKGKIYELSTWIKISPDGEKAFPTTKLQFYGYYWDSSAKSRAPATTLDLPSGGIDWQYIASLGMHIDIDNTLYFNPRLDMATSTEGGGIAQLTGVSIHEVVFDELKLSDTLVELDPEETHTISATHLSNTGNEFHSFYYYNASGRGIIKPTYKSENTAVATVDEATGLITAVGAGETTITATSTIGSVTKTAEVKVKVLGNIPEPEPTPELPGGILASIDEDMLTVGKTYIPTVTDSEGKELSKGITVSYSVKDENIATVTEDGAIKPAAPGRTTITATASNGEDSITDDFEINVIGKNLLNARKYKQGEFERGVFLTDKSLGADDYQRFWKSTKNATTYVYDYILQEDVISEITGEKTNIPKFSMKPTGASNRIRIQGYQRPYYTSADQRFLIEAKAYGLYEMTGYIKSENTNTLPVADMRMYYYNDTSANGISIKGMTTKPWAEKSGDQPWTEFTTGSLYLNYEYGDTYGIEPRLDFVASGCQGADISVSHLSVYEVAFDRAELTLTGATEGLGYGDTISTKLELYSNTGNLITLGKKLDSDSLSYSSSDTAVATVDPVTGVITAVANGEVTITANVTINGVTREASAVLNISGIEKTVSRAEVSAEKTTLVRGETLPASYKLFYNDGEEFTGESEVYWYESENTAVATISQDGVITAASAGETNIILWIEADGREIKGVLPIAVADDSPLASAEIYGADSVEAGFSASLSVRAKHESGKEAYMDVCDVTFALENADDAAYLTVDAKSGVITGVSEKDSVNVIATVTCGSSSVNSEPFAVKVTPKSPKSKIIDFKKPGSGYAIDVKTEDYDWAVNEGKSASVLLGSANSKLRCFTQGVQAQLTKVGQTRNADLALDIKVDYDGWYEIDFLGTIYYRGANKANLYMDGKYMGDFCFWTDISTNRNYNTLKSLNTMYLTEGVHTFTIRTMTYSPEGSYSYVIPAYLSLSYVEGLGGLDSVELSAGKESLAVGEKTTVSSKAVMAGGREYSFGNMHGNKADPDNYLTLESSDAGIVKVSGSTLTAVSPGKATITATAKVGDHTEIKTLDITVTDDKLAKVEFTTPGYDIYILETTYPSVKAYLTNGNEISSDNISVTYSVEDNSVATLNGTRILVGVAEGETNLTATVTFAGVSIPVTVPVKVRADGLATLELGAVTQVIKAGGEGTELYLRAYDNKGKAIEVANDAITYKSSDESIVTVSANGHITPVSVGVAEIYADVTVDGVTKTAKITISVRDGKVSSTYYTEEKVSAARENIERYDWAKDIADAAIEEADKYLPYYEYIYNMTTAHTLPRAYDLVETEDPLIWRCFYCGIDLNYKYGKYSWKTDPINRPWKIQCPDCKRQFPANDFGAYYERGLDSHGEFDRTLALEENGILCGRGERNENGEYVVFDWAKDNPYGYGDPNGNLYNKLYQELQKNPIDPFYKDEITQGWGDFKTGEGTGVPNTGYFWGVDDGFGYDTGRYNTKEGLSIRNVHRYIAVFNHDAIWYGSDKDQLLYRSVQAFRDAYLYTGDKKYARAGAIILDRIADLYPDFDYMTDCPDLQSSHGGGKNGKVVGSIWENFLNRELITAYDAFFDIYDDPEVISFLSGYAEKWNLDNKKTNGELIRQNAEDNIVYETYTAIKNSQIQGNFGLKQHNLAKAAVVLDRDPDTQEMVEFILQPGVSSRNVTTGGEMRPALMNRIDRDGYADESSMGYMGMWVSNFLPYMDALENWDGLQDEDNLYKNPKFIKMLYMGIDRILAGVRDANIGDNSGGFAGVSFPNYTSAWLEGLRLTGDPIFAQLLWHVNEGKAEEIHYGIFVKDPESPQEEIEALVEQYGEYNFSESSITTGGGFAALRDGVMYDNVTAPTQSNTMRDWWIYFGGAATTHKHKDTLNLGLDAFGLNMAPDLGYFTSSGGAGTGQGENWTESTLSHNTVLVNDTPQVRIKEAGYPYHFDDAGEVKVMDIDAPQAYPGVTDTYRRTIVSIDVDDTVSYALDFFRIVGGDEHLYSFHSQSEESTVEGVDMVAQPRGSYAGVDVPFGEETKYTATNGFNWLANVERAIEPGTGEFSIDFKITDYRKLLKGKRNLHLKLTQLNDFDISEVAVADGQPVQREHNPEWTDYLLVRRSGKDLDTLFTSVIEPYEDTSKISSLSRVPVKHTDGTEIGKNETVAAIKVVLTNGRCDYVVYADDNSIAYNIDNLFDFRGFVGVYSVNANDSSEVVRTYLHDGTTLGEAVQDATPAITGEVVSFTDTLSLENFIEVTMNESIDLDELIGRMIVIDNDGGQNGAYIIKSVEKKGDNVLIGTGNVTLIRSLADDGSTYIMNIAKGNTYRIPLTYADNNAPEIAVPETLSASVGGSIKIPLDVISDREYTLTGTTMPRGMALDEESETLIWKPESSQVGDNHIAITVDNGVMSNTIHFIVTVYGSTTGGGGDVCITPEAPVTPDKPEVPDEPSKPETPDAPSTDGGNARFIDLGNHVWAADAINSLADAGIIKGTSENTFSPGNNITRADFAILLVRAFEKTSDNTENFADVSESDYFAKELAIARNTGLVSGIGDNKFAPRENIKRCDMMLMVYRVLSETEAFVGRAAPGTPSYPDFDSVPDYAKEAVSALIGAGLVNGKGDRIAPLDYTTRAEVAVLLKRILDYIK